MMTRTTGQGGDEEPPVLSPSLADILRPELASLADEIITQLREKIPEFARPIDGPYGQIMRTGVEQALASFVDLVADPAAPPAGRDEVALMLGKHEAEEGRSLDSLQAAYRIGAQAAWQRVMEVGQRAQLSSAVMSALADAVFRYIDDLATVSHAGYREVRARTAEAQQAARSRLLQLILDRDDPVPLRALADLAGVACWPLPDQVIAVAIAPARSGTRPDVRPGARSDVRPGSGPGGRSDTQPDGWPGAQAEGQLGTRAGTMSGARDTAPAVVTLSEQMTGYHEILANLDEPQPHLLVPGDAEAGRWAALAAQLGGRRAAIGLAVPLADAADSLRWARQVLALAENGTIDAGPLVLCEDHLVTLWLLSDTALADQVSRRHFGVLEALSPRQQERLTETFGAWLETRGTAAEIADRLQVHPQTVRYRIRQLERTLGDQFGDPDARFAMEMVLRVMRLREKKFRTKRAGP
jgi:PucR C-terminal helix-turn-helix domain